MTVTRSKVLTHLEAVEGRQRRYRATVHAAYSAGTFTPETRVRARRAFGVLRVKRIRLSEWLNTHPRPRS